MKQFNLEHHKWEDYRGTRFYNKDCPLVIKRWFNKVEEDTSGLTFQEWTPDVDTSRPPVDMLINSSELRAADFKLKEVLSPTLETVARGGMRTRGAGVRSLEGMGPKRFVCQWITTLCLMLLIMNQQFKQTFFTIRLFCRTQIVLMFVKGCT